MPTKELSQPPLEEICHSFFRNSPDFIFLLNRDYNIVSLNKSAADLVGKPKKAILGKKISYFFPEAISNVQVSSLARVFKTGKAFNSVSKYSLNKKEVWLDVTLAPLKNKKGKTEFVLGVCRNVTESMQTESKLNALVSSMADMVFGFDKNTRFTYFHSPEHSLLYVPPKKFLGKKHSKVMPPDVVKLFNKAWKELRKNGTARFEYPLKLKGKELWFSAVMSAIKDEKGNFDGAVAVVRDATDIAKTQMELKEKMKELQQFQKFFVDRELKMVELKKQIKGLESK